MLLSLLALAAMGCTDHPLTQGVEPPRDPVERLTAGYTCSVDMVAGRVACREETAGGGEGMSLALLGQNQIKMAGANNSYDSITSLYQLDATVQNLLSHPIGTPDGVERTGVKVFFETGPVATQYKAVGDTGTVYLLNHDGTQGFTAPGQPYFHYDTILAPQEVSSPRTWQMHVPPTVARFGFTVKVFTFTPPEEELPIPAPTGWVISADSVATLYAPTNSVLTHPRLSGPYPRSILIVGFDPAATREERLAAMNSVDGRLVGGHGGALYTFVLPANRTADDLWAAVDRVRALPQVGYAAPDFLSQRVVPAYLRPHDGPDWRKQDWALAVDSAGDFNWGPEAIAAPFAWGCEIGNAETRLSVLDVQQRHGEQVRSIIDSPADDGAGMAGLMWNGSVTLRVGNVHSTFAAAMADSAHVLNISLALGYYDGLGNRRRPQNTTADLDESADFAAAVIEYLEHLETLYEWQPLYVIAAGNYERDAQLSGFPRIRADAGFAARTLVVSAGSVGDSAAVANRDRPRMTNTGSTVEPGASYGTLVDISAPGVGVYTAPVGFAADTVSGTSFAAPHVAGVAGLLKSFDPRLSATQIRQHILDGAARGGWTGSGVGFLNAYEALKSAARETGAPLCGQRFWMQDGEFVVQRDSASGTTETLFTLPVPAVNSANAMHGGKEIHFYSGGEITYRWNQTQLWHESTPTTEPYPQRRSNATMLSRDLTSHDADSFLDYYTQTVGNTVRIRLETYDTLYNFTAVPGYVSVPHTTGAQQCLQEYVSVHPDDDARLRTTSDSTAYLSWLAQRQSQPCFQWAGPPSSSGPSHVRAAYSPRGEAAYVFVSNYTQTVTVDAWVACGKEGTFYGSGGVGAGGFEARVNLRCRGGSLSGQATAGAAFRVALPSGAVTPLGWSIPAGRLEAPSIRENLRELTLQLRPWQTSQTFGWQQTGTYAWAYQTSGGTTDSCTLQFRNLATGAVELAPPVGCQADGGDAGIAPMRAVPLRLSR